MTSRLSAGLATACASLALAFSTSASADVIADQSFAAGLGTYSATGSVSVVSAGARLRGGSGPGRITSAVIDTARYRRIRLTVDRTTSGLDAGEAGTIAITANGQARTLEATRSASGSTTFDLGDAVGALRIDVSLAASSALETFTIGRVTVEGDPTDTTPPPQGRGTIVPDSSWTCALPGGIPDPSRGTLVFTTTLAADTPIEVGTTPYGNRRVTRTTGGTLSGGSLGGTVLSGSLDFDLRLPSGAVEHEARYTLRAPDQTLIYLRNCGVADGTNTRVVSFFEAPSSSSWQWLNSGTYVGVRQVTSSGIKLSVYAVSATPNPADPVTRVPADASLRQQAWECSGAPATASQGSQVMSARVSIGSSQAVGTTPKGRRNIIPITGGTYSGTAGSGSVNPGGADYQLTVSGDLNIEARYTLKASSGETIVVRNCGSFGTSDLTQVIFEARSGGAHEALNAGQFVGTITPGLGRVTIGVFERR